MIKSAKCISGKKESGYEAKLYNISTQLSPKEAAMYRSLTVWTRPQNREMSIRPSVPHPLFPLPDDTSLLAIKSSTLSNFADRL